MLAGAKRRAACRRHGVHEVDEVPSVKQVSCRSMDERPHDAVQACWLVLCYCLGA